MTKSILKKEHVWKVGDQVFHSEKEADAFIAKEERIGRAADLLQQLQQAIATEMARESDPFFRRRLASSATVLGESFRPELIARAFAFKPDVLEQLHLILQGDDK